MEREALAVGLSIAVLSGAVGMDCYAGRMAMRAATGEEQQLIGFLMLAMGVAMSGWAGFVAMRVRRRLAASNTTTATVVDTRRVGRASSPAYRVIVEFSDTEGKTHRFTSRAAASGWAAMKGKPVELLYRRDDPTDARIKAWWVQWMMSTMIGGSAAVCFIIGTVLLLAG